MHLRGEFERVGNTPASQNPVDQFHPAHRADAARGTLAAAFRRAEFHREARHAAHVGGIVKHGDPGVTDQRIDCRIGFVIELDIELVGVDIRPERPANLHGLDRAPALGPAADVIHQLAQGDAEGYLEQPAMLDITGKLDRHRALRTAHPVAVVMACAAFFQDVRNGGQSQHVVDHGGLAEQAFQRGQRRLGAHFAALAFEAVEQGRFFAAHIGASAHTHFAFERRKNMRALGQSVVQLADRIGIFAADIDITLIRTDCFARDGQAFEQVERIAFHHHSVGKGGAVAFIGIADDVFLGSGRIGHGLPLDPGGETRAAAPTQARLQHFSNDRLPADGARAGQADKAAMRHVIVKIGRAGFARTGEGQPLLFRDERVLGDFADGFGAAAIEDRIDIGQSGGAETLTIDIDQRLKPMHPPAGNAVNFVALGGEGIGQLVCTQSAGEGIVGNTNKHQAFSITWARLAASSRANSSSPTRAFGPLEQRPRQ